MLLSVCCVEAITAADIKSNCSNGFKLWRLKWLLIAVVSGCLGTGMKSSIRQALIWMALASALSACTSVQLYKSTSRSSLLVATAEQQLVDKLNARYKNIVEACEGNTPAYYCSGIMLRTIGYNPDYDFWTHSPPAAQLGSLTFSYVRLDLGSDGTGIGSGIIFSDQETALAQDKSVIVRCIYPFMAGTQGTGRPGFGCGFAAKGALRKADLSTCATLAVPAITAELWLENFLRFGSDVASQCSLSTLDAGQFNASIEAHNGVDAIHSAARNELLIATWREEVPERLPIEAFFYNTNTAAAGLFNAQALRHVYYLRTSRRIPIIRVDFTASDKNIFSLSDADQIDGWDVADRLNSRYNDISYDCNGLPAFHCTGVLVRMTTYGSEFHSWNPNPANPGGVSFSYLRQDLKMTHAIWMGRIEQGFAFKESRYFGLQKIYPLMVMCSFAYDASSTTRNEKGCGATPSFPSASRPCEAQGITTLDAWRVHFMSVSSIYDRYIHQCGFKADQRGFAVSLIARENPEAELENVRHNEVIFDKWPQDIPAQLPIEAFVYIYDQSKSLGLDGARFIQKDYFNQTRLAIPVIGIAFASGGDNIFIYRPGDQGL